VRLAQILAAAALAVAPVVAADRHAELAAAFGLRSGASLDSDTPGIAGAEAGASVSWGLSAGWRARPDGWLEVLLDHQTLAFSQTRGTGSHRFDFGVDYLQLGGGYEPPAKGTRRYVTIAAGLGFLGAESGSLSRAAGLSGSLGAGFKVPVGDKTLLRLEARGWAILTGGAVDVACGPGCRLSLGGSGFWQLGVRAAIAYCPSGSR